MTFVEALAQTLAFTRNRDEANAQDLAEATTTAARWNARRASMGLKPFSDVSAPIRSVVIIDDEGGDDA